LRRWRCSGLDSTRARPPPNLTALTTQASAIIAGEAARGGEVLRHGPSAPALRALDAIHDRLESPADRLLRNAGARSSYLVLPLFALANAVLFGTVTVGVRRMTATESTETLTMYQMLLLTVVFAASLPLRGAE